MQSATENRKIAVRLADGLTVEAVWYPSGTLCISSQGGCAVGCPFCASGARGLFRQLSADEMNRQVELALESGLVPARITLSGTGEPLHNFASVREFLAHCRRQGLEVSLTTTGAPLGHLAELLQDEHNGLMVSVHAGSPAVHRSLIPHGPDLAGLWNVLGGVWPRLSRRQRRKIGINYLLLAGINDVPAEIDLFTQKMRLLPEATVHLLSLNPVPGSFFSSPGAEVFAAAHQQLRCLGIHVRRVNRWRGQAEGGCGTLLAHGGLPPLATQAAWVDA